MHICQSLQAVRKNLDKEMIFAINLVSFSREGSIVMFLIYICGVQEYKSMV